MDFEYFFHHLWTLASNAVDLSNPKSDLFPLRQRVWKHLCPSSSLSLQPLVHFFVELLKTLPLWVRGRTFCLLVSAKSFSWNFLSFDCYCCQVLLCCLVSLAHVLKLYCDLWQQLRSLRLMVSFLQPNSAFTTLRKVAWRMRNRGSSRTAISVA